MSPARYRLGIDIGGTFTDLQVMDEQTGALYGAKTPSIPADPAEAVVTGIRELERRFGIRPRDIGYFAHGTTLAVNTLLERNGAPGGVLMTRGFTDTLELRRLRLPKANDFFVPKPVPLVPRRRVKPIIERMLSDGRVLIPIEREDVIARAAELVKDGISTLAICFLHAHKNPRHEQLAKAWVEAAHPDLYVCTSAELWPQQREYERSLLSVINAYVGGRMRAYFHTLERRVAELGMTCRVFSTKSNGGVMSLASAAARPVETLLSGPASGVIGAAYLGTLMGDTRLVTLDMGGTSVDVSIVDDEIRYSTENTVGDFPVIMPAVDVSAVGAGGGSIAWTDAEGVLKVGPRSAGADPGPACYARGGTLPTVTDAYVTAGIISPERFLGGEMPLHATLARGAIRAIGETLGYAEKQTADAILQVTTSNIYAELLPQLARRGIDTSDFSLVAYGAAGPTHVFMLARDLNLRRIIVPPSPGLLCALGCLAADLRADFVKSIWRETRELDSEELRRLFADLHERAKEWIAEQRVFLDRVYILRSAEMCYVGQSYEVNVTFPDTQLESLTTESLIDWFHTRYARLYGRADVDSATRVVEARLQIVGVSPRPAVRLLADRSAAPTGPSGSRPIFESGVEVLADVWQRGSMRPGTAYFGPMVVEQYDTTVYIPSGFEVRVDERGSLIGEKLDD